MFRGDLIIDGYNVLHAAHLAPSHAAGELEQARASLLRLISDRLTAKERSRTTVVFDAPVRFLGPSPPQESQGLLVMFADRDGDADAAIERLIRQNSAPRRLCIVSSDRRLQKAARRRRGKFLDSDEFLRRLARRSLRTANQIRQEPAAKHSGKLPPGEVDAWLRVFEDRFVEELEGIAAPSCADPSHRGKTSGAGSSGAGSKAEAPKIGGTNGEASAAGRSKLRRQPASKAHNGDNGSRLKPRPASDEEDAGLSDEISFWESRIAQLEDEQLR